jgi:hypothetical protein
MGPQSDPAGQAGLGVGYYEGGKLQDELIFDQQTGRLLSHETYDQSGNLSFWDSYSQHEVVTTLPNYPLAHVGIAPVTTTAGGTTTSGS